MLLTIAVPTFNRATHLARLLHALDTMVTDSLADHIELLISDNASTDDSATVIADFANQRPQVVTIRNHSNIGADANVQQCFERAKGTYVWILGDDDMPKVGVIEAVIASLSRETPDLAFLPSEWLPVVTGPDQGDAVDPHAYDMVERTAFARRTNVWLTFLSGIIVRKAHASDIDFAPVTDSNLPQLAWVLPALKRGTRFCVFRDRLVLATAANSGGYPVVQVFGANLSILVARAFGRKSSVYKAVIGPTVLGYLPQLVLNVRLRVGHSFAVEFPWKALDREIGRFPAYWVFVQPVGRAPLPIARATLLAARVVSKIVRMSRGL